MVDREEYKILLKRIQEPIKFIQVIAGPRQVGKTTMARAVSHQYNFPVHFVSADDTAEASAVWIEQQWENARLKIRAEGGEEGLLIIDEVQKIPDWSRQVKAEWDWDRRNDINLKVLLLGSSQLLLHKGLTESLAGRFELTKMTHWSFHEMQRAFDFTPEDYVLYGGYPGAAELKNEPVRWKNYIRDSLIETTLSKDILMLHRVNKPALLRNLFHLGCQYSSRILSFNKMLGQLQEAGNTTTLSHYLNLLDTAGLLTGLSKFYQSRPVHQKGSSPKLQVYNTALMTAQSRKEPKAVLNDSALWGHWVESAIGSHLLNQAWKSDFQVLYWREGSREVDFVLQYGEELVALEVKSSYKGNKSGLDTFKQKFKPNKIYLIGKNGIPWEEFLTMPVEALFG